MADKAYVSSRGLTSTKTRLLRGAFGVFVFTIGVGGSLYSELLTETGYLIFLGLALLSSVTIFLVVRPERFRWYRLPAPVVLFLAAMAVALFWAPDLKMSVLRLLLMLALAVIAIAVSYVLTWPETLRTLASALRYLMGVGLIVWGFQNFILKTEPSVSLALVSVIALSVFIIQTSAGLVRPGFGGFWILAAVLGVIVSQSAITYAAVIVVFVSAMFLLWARKSSPDSRMPIYFIGLFALAATIFALFWWHEAIFGAVGLELSESFFDSVWFSIWQGEGIVAGIFFLLLVFVTTWRVWFRAVDQPRRGAGAPLDYSRSALWPALVTMSLLVFSLFATPSVLFPGWFLLVLFAVKTRFDYIVPSKQEDQKRLAWRDVPLTLGSTASGVRSR